MKQDLQILFMVLLAIAIAFCLLKFLSIKRRETTAWLLMFALLSIAAIMTGNLYIVLGGLLLIKVFYAGNDLDRNLTMFLFLLPILPVSGKIMLPAPNIHFVQANFTLLVMLVFLVPMVPKLVSESKLMQRKILFYIPFIYITVREIPFLLADTIDLTHTAVNQVIEQTTTNKIRDSVLYVVKYILPYYALVSWINSHKRLNLALFAISTSGLVVMIIAFPSGVLSWDFFRGLFGDVAESFRYRGGLLRLNVNMEHSITFGYYATIFMGAFFATVSVVKFNLFRFIVIMACALPAIFFTDSKGAMVGALITIMAFFYFKMRGSSRKITGAFLATLLFVIALPFLLASGDRSDSLRQDVNVNSLDSFEYRKRLALAEWELIVQKPLFGYPDAFRTPEMEAMRQGEGIIDPVNTYLTIAMTRGLICMMMYLVLIYAGIRGVMRYIQAGFESRKSRRVLVGAALAATYLSISVQMIFTSFNGMIVVYFWIVSGICMGVSKGMTREMPKSKETVNFGLIKEPL